MYLVFTSLCDKKGLGERGAIVRLQMVSFGQTKKRSEM